MARLETTGYELNDTTGSLEPTFATGVTVDSSTVRTGSFAQKIDLTAAASANSTLINITGGLTTTYFARAYVNFASFGSAGAAGDFRGILGDATVKVGVGLSSGVLKFVLPGGTLDSVSYAPSLGTWYRVEFSYQATSGAWEWRVDGATISTGTTTSVTAPNSFRTGSFASLNASNLWVATFDDVAINDSTGAAQTSWCGDGKVVLLVPASDNAVGAGWTLGTGTAISANSGSTAVKNKPPVGVADLTAGSDTKQIRNASANANTNYDANLTTYTAAGIGASDTVNVLVPVVATAAPVTTSSKQGTVGVSANPVIANVALGALGTAGAFWQGNAGGTYNSGWKWSFGTTTYAPTVTVGSAPVMRITQVTSSTRIAVVCFMGMYVDYTPAVVIPPTPLVHQSIPFYPRASRPS